MRVMLAWNHYMQYYDSVTHHMLATNFFEMLQIMDKRYTSLWTEVIIESLKRRSIHSTDYKESVASHQGYRPLCKHTN